MVSSLYSGFSEHIRFSEFQRNFLDLLVELMLLSISLQAIIQNLGQLCWRFQTTVRNLNEFDQEGKTLAVSIRHTN